MLNRMCLSRFSACPWYCTSLYSEYSNYWHLAPGIIHDGGTLLPGNGIGGTGTRVDMTDSAHDCGAPLFRCRAYSA